MVSFPVQGGLFNMIVLFRPDKKASKTTQLINSETIMNQHFYSVIYKEIVTVSNAVLFRSETKSSGFHATERPESYCLRNLNFCLALEGHFLENRIWA